MNSYRVLLNSRIKGEIITNKGEYFGGVQKIPTAPLCIRYKGNLHLGLFSANGTGLITAPSFPLKIRDNNRYSQNYNYNGRITGILTYLKMVFGVFHGSVFWFFKK